MNRRHFSPRRVAATVDRALAVGQALHQAGAPVGTVEGAVESLGRARGLDVQCLAGPTSIQVVHDGRARLVRVGPAGIDLAVQAGLARMVSTVGPVAAHPLPAVSPRARPPVRAAWSEVLLWAWLALSASVSMGVGDGTVLAAGALGALVGALVVRAEQQDGLGALVPLVGALVASGGARALSTVWTLDPVIAPLAAILVLLPGWGLTVGVGEVATGHLASGSARLVAAFVTLLQLALGWVAGAEGVAWLWPAAPTTGGMLEATTLPSWSGVPGVAMCFALLFRADVRHWGWVAAGVGLAWGAARLGVGVLPGAYLGSLLIGVLGALLHRLTGLPSQLATIPGVMLMVPGGALLVAVLQLVRHDPAGLSSMVDSLGVSGALVGGLLTARLVLPMRK